MKIACGAWSMHSLEKDRIGGPQAIVWRGDVAGGGACALHFVPASDAESLRHCTDYCVQQRWPRIGTNFRLFTASRMR
jgi:hypothetical protein